VTSDRFERLKHVVMTAAGLSGDDRTTFLDDACKGDPAFRREAEEILAHQDDYPHVLEAGAVIPIPKQDPLVGCEVSHYRVLERVGEGGMGAVYKAEDTRLHRHVALKFLARDLVATDKLRERFTHEARAAAALDHPNVCTVYDVEEVNGETFIAMAYVEGESLRETLSMGGLETAHAIEIALQVAQGLEAAHAKRIAHRDIKPSNIMVTPSGRVKIMDFGLARSATQAGLTETGMVMGTASYMSPEQARGEHVDHRTDIWSLGAVLYEMVTGERPFKGASSEAVLYSILHEEPAVPRSVKADLPGQVDTVIANALEKDPERRYQAAAQMADDLRTLRRSLRPGVPLESLPPIRRMRRPGAAESLLRRVAATAGRRWVAMAVGAAVALAAYGGVRRLVHGPSEPVLDPDRVVVVAFENRTGDAGLDHVGLAAGEWIREGVSQIGLGEVLPTVMTVTEPSPRTVGNSPGRLDASNTRALAWEAGTGLVVSGTYHSLQDSIQFRANVTQMPGEKTISTVASDLTARDASLDAIEEFRQRIMGGLAIHLSPEMVFESYPSPPPFEAYGEYAAGLGLFGADFAGAAEHLARAVQLDSGFVEPHLWLAAAHSSTGDWGTGETVLRTLNQRRAALTALQRCGLDYMLASFQGRHREAWRHVMQAARLAPGSGLVNYLILWEASEMNYPRMAVKVSEEVGGPGKFQRHGIMALFWYANLTDALHKLGDYQRELDVAQEAREHFPDVVYSWVDEARALAALGRIEELNQLLQECPSAEPTWWFTVGDLLVGTARELRAHGYMDAAQEVADRAVEWSRKLRFELYPGEDARMYVARSLYVAERWEEAREAFDTLAREYPESAYYLGATGRVAARLGDREEALRVFEELQTIDRPYIFGRHDYASAQIASLLGDYEEAVVLLAKAFDQTYEYTSPVLNDPDLLLMRGYPGWEELIRPKG
jgi:tetratricopeptide (TPR) repeat protein/tRNA A-37 threonylcarbamoyl transferase component Bud32